MWEKADRRLKSAGALAPVLAAACLRGTAVAQSAGDSDFMPYGYCYLWNTNIVLLHVISDGLITLSYFCIPIGLIYVAKKRGDLPFNWIFWMFGGFIVSCGMTHFMEIWTIWHATYMFAGVLKAATAALSVMTAVMMVPLIPKAIALPSPTQLRDKNRDLQLAMVGRDLTEQHLRQTLHERELALAELADRRAAVEELQLVQEALHGSQDRLNAIIHSAMDGIITVDEEQRVLIFNAAAERMFGCKADEVVGGAIERLIPQRFRFTHGRHIRCFGETGTTSQAMGEHGAVWGLRANGEEFPLEASISQVTAGGNKLFTVILRDITERRRMEEERERLAAVVESSDDAIITKTRDGIITGWNRSAEKLFGYSRLEAIGWPMIMLFPPERSHEEREILARIVRGHSVEHYETVRIRKDESRIDVEVAVSPIKDPNGKIVGASSITRDITARLRADARSVQLAAIVESSADAIFSKDFDGTILTWNQGAERMFGYSEAEAVGKPIQIIPPEREKEVEEFNRGIQEGRRMAREATTRRCKDGSLLDVSIIMSPLRDSQGRIRGASVIARDITANKRAQEELRESEERFQALANGMQQLAWMAGADGSIYWYNQRWYEYTGTTFEQMQGWGWQSVHDPEALPKVLERWKASIAGGEPFDMEFPLRGADGRFRMFLTRGMPVKSPGGGGVRWFGTNTDISERREAEERLARQTEELTRSREALESQTLMLQSVLGSVAEGLVAANEQGKFILWNEAAETMLGHGPADIPAEAWSEHYGTFLPDGVTRYATEQLPLVRALRGEECSCEIFLRNPKIKEGIWIEANASPLKGQDGKLRGGVVALRDVTKSKADEREIRKLNEGLEQRVQDLARSNKELEQFAYVASHDLQEPLRMVASYTQLLSERYGGKLDAAADKFIGYASEGALRMQVLIQDLLAFSRVGRTGGAREMVDMKVVLEEIRLNLASAIEESGAGIACGELPLIWADRAQMIQLFQNLIGNAIKFHGEARPEIAVSVESAGANWLFSVKDNGIGIAAEYVENIFVVFQRLHARTEYPGNGIGLAICKKIVEFYGGRIWVESERGRGSTFQFTLPAAIPRMAEPRPEPVGAHS